MEHYQFPVACKLNVKLDIVRTALDSRFKCRHGIFGSGFGSATVSRYLSAVEYSHIQRHIALVYLSYVGNIRKERNSRHYKHDTETLSMICLNIGIGKFKFFLFVNIAVESSCEPAHDRRCGEERRHCREHISCVFQHFQSSSESGMTVREALYHENYDKAQTERHSGDSGNY